MRTLGPVSALSTAHFTAATTPDFIAFGCAFARPYLNGQFTSGRSVVLVMDTSASMAATDEQPNRLSAAQIRATAAVDNLSPGDEVLLIEAGPQTRVVTSFSRDVSVVRVQSHPQGLRKERFEMECSWRCHWLALAQM